MELAASSKPAKKEMGPVGLVAEIAAITVVLGLVIRRGRRVVGGA
jgi:hypothetical protein